MKNLAFIFLFVATQYACASDVISEAKDVVTSHERFTMANNLDGVMTVAADDCPNSNVLSAKVTGCTEKAAKAEFASKAKTKCDTECAKNTWDEKDCIRFGYVAGVHCRPVVGTDCEGGTGFECKVPGAGEVECVCKCDSST